MYEDHLPFQKHFSVPPQPTWLASSPSPGRRTPPLRVEPTTTPISLTASRNQNEISLQLRAKPHRQTPRYVIRRGLKEHTPWRCLTDMFSSDPVQTNHQRKRRRRDDIWVERCIAADGEALQRILDDCKVTFRNRPHHPANGAEYYRYVITVMHVSMWTCSRIDGV